MRALLDNLKMAGLVLGSLLIFHFPSFSAENVEELKKQIEALQKRVEELEAAQSKVDEESEGFFDHRLNNTQGDPFQAIQRMQKEMDQMFQDAFGQQGRTGGGMFSGQMAYDDKLDIQEEENQYIVRIDLTGLDQDKVEVEIHAHSITVSGKYSSEDIQESPNQFFRAQNFGSFLKTIPLPVDADTERTTTEKQGDYLVITLPKQPA